MNKKYDEFTNELKGAELELANLRRDYEDSIIDLLKILMLECSILVNVSVKIAFNEAKVVFEEQLSGKSYSLLFNYDDNDDIGIIIADNKLDCSMAASVEYLMISSHLSKLLQSKTGSFYDTFIEAFNEVSILECMVNHLKYEMARISNEYLTHKMENIRKDVIDSFHSGYAFDNALWEYHGIDYKWAKLAIKDNVMSIQAQSVDGTMDTYTFESEIDFYLQVWRAVSKNERIGYIKDLTRTVVTFIKIKEPIDVGHCKSITYKGDNIIGLCDMTRSGNNWFVSVILKDNESVFKHQMSLIHLMRYMYLDSESEFKEAISDFKL